MLHVDLMSADTQDRPTESALASVVTTVNVTTTAGYFTYDLLGSAFDNFTLTPETKYALVLYTLGGDCAAGLAWNASSGAASGFQ